MARYMRTDLGSGHSKLLPPRVVTEPGYPVEMPRIRGRLHDIGVVQETIRQRGAKFALHPPTVVFPPAIYSGPKVIPPQRNAVWQRHNQRRTLTYLFPPAPGTILPRIFAPIDGYLTPAAEVAFRIRQRKTTSRLRPPTVVTPAGAQAALAVHLAPSPRQARRTMAGVRSPIFVLPAITYPPVAVHFAYSRRGKPKSILRKPAVADNRPQVYYLATTFAPSPRQTRAAHSRVIFPYVVFVADEKGGILVSLAPSPRERYVTSRLRAPIVIAAAQAFYGPNVYLTYSRRGVPKVHLGGPVVIDLRPQVYYIATTLTYSRRGAPHSFLRPPTVVDTRIYFGPSVYLTYSRRGAPKSTLHAPVVIDLRPQTYYLATALAYSRRGVTKSRLRPPVVVATGEVSYGPSVNLTYSRRGKALPDLGFPVVVTDATVYATGQIGVSLAPTLRQPRASHPRFIYPIVIFSDVVVVDELGGIGISLAPSPRQARATHSRFIYPVVVLAFTRKGGTSISLVRRPTPSTKSFLRPAVVVVAEQRVYGAPKAPFVRIRPRRTLSVLRTPRVVFLAVEIYGPETSLARNKPQPTTTFLRPPVVVRLAVEIYGPEVTLAQNKPKPTTTFLRPPVVVRLAIEIYGPETQLARIRPRPTTHFLRPPVDVVDEQDKGYVRVHFAYSRRGAPKSTLHPPVVIDNSPQTYYLTIWLAYSRRGKPGYRLAPPQVVFVEEQPLARPILTHLAYSVRLPGRVELRPPVVVFPFLARATQVHLAYSLRGQAKSFLRKPLVAAVYYGPSVTLTYSRRGKPESFLRPPAVIDLRPQTYYLSVTLARITPPPVFSRLIPPASIAAVLKAELDLRVTLAYSRRGKTRPRLRGPVVIDLRSQTRFLRVKLTYSRRGRPKSRLFNFIVRDRFFGPKTTLAYSRRGRPLSELKPPVVVGLAVEIYGPETWLTYSRRGAPKSTLHPPTVVGQRPFREILTHLTYSRRGRPVYELKPPAVVAPVLARRISITLAPQRRGRPISFLNPPTRVFAFVARATQITLAPQARGKTRSFLNGPIVVREFVAAPIRLKLVRITHPPVGYSLAPPVVVTFPQPVLYPISVTLAYSLRGKPKPFLRQPTVTIFVPPAGDVCGFDIAGSFVCEEIETDTAVIGGTEGTSFASGASASGSTISGGDSAAGEVFGDDQESN